MGGAHTSRIIIATAEIQADILTVISGTRVSPANSIGGRERTTALCFIKVEEVSQQRRPLGIRVSTCCWQCARRCIRG